MIARRTFLSVLVPAVLAAGARRPSPRARSPVAPETSADRDSAAAPAVPGLATPNEWRDAWVQSPHRAHEWV